VFLPIGDENPRERTPYVNYAILAINIAVFFLLSLPSPEVSISYALRPARIADGLDPDSILTLFTSMFLHGSLMHLVGNMLFLWIFGDNIEDKLGHVLYVVFYLGCGLAADAAHILYDPNSDIPTLGASGAISGVVGAYVLFFPKHRIKMLLFLFYFVDFVYIPAWIWTFIWFGTQVLYQIIESTREDQGGGGVAYLAHIGGFGAGIAFAALWKYGLFRNRFGVDNAEPYPRDMVAPAHPDRRGRIARPFVTPRNDGIEFVDEPHERWAVLRVSDELSAAGKVAMIVEQHAGVPARETQRRLAASRGVIARGVPRVPAERIQQELRVAGVDTLIIPDDRSTQPPPPLTSPGVAWDDEHVEFVEGGRLVEAPWEQPFLYIAAAADGGAFIDIFVSVQHRVRVTNATDVREIDPDSGAPEPATLAALAHAILFERRSAVVNDGLRVLASGGSWGWLAFRDMRDYEDYAFWMYNVLLARKPIHRF
jgi:rhomboid family protein